MEKEWDFLLTGDYVLLFKNGEFVVERNKSLGIKEGVIDFIGEMPNSAEVKKKYHFKDHLLCPGLVNTHTHIPMSLFRGLADNIPLKKWLEDYIFPLENQFVDRDFVRVGSLLSAAELIKSGTTTFCDMYFYNDAIAKAQAISGLRGFLGLAIPSVEKDWPKWKEKITQLSQAYKNNAKVNFALAPHAPYTVSPEILQDIGLFAKENHHPILIHVSESLWEQEEIKKRYSKTPVEHLHSLGLTGPKTLFAHCVHVTKTDRDIMRETQTSLSYNPESNMKLSNGIAPITEALREGLTVGIGTDGSASNNNLDLFGEMDTGIKLQSIRYGEDSLTAMDMLKLATVGGARALGLEDKIGTLEEGKRADIIAIDLKKPHFYPHYNLVSHLVYAAQGPDVRFVMCEGQVLMEDYKIKTLNTEEIYRETLAFEKQIKQFLHNKKSESS